MISIPTIKTKRLTVELRELTIRQSIELAKMSPEMIEDGNSKFLGFVVQKMNLPIEEWTIQERLFCIGQYLSKLSDEPNFVIGGGSYLDYLDIEKDYQGKAFAGEVAGDRWHYKPVTGAQIEAVEGAASDRQDWFFGLMAASLEIEGEIVPSAHENPTDYLEWLAKRKDVFANYSESDFSDLLAAYKTAEQKAMQFFDLSVDKQGIVVNPKEGEGDKMLSPARFSAFGCVSDLAKSLCG
jgi:hypothetical protein